MAALSVSAARRTAQELVNAGAGTIFLFGSLARREASAVSDIDLVAIFDDLVDCGDRSDRHGDVGVRARAAAAAINLDQLHEWRQGVNYADARPVKHFDEAYLRRPAAAAIRVAEFASDQCRDGRLDADLLRRFGLRLGRCAASLAGVLRISA